VFYIYIVQITARLFASNGHRYPISTSFSHVSTLSILSWKKNERERRH